MAATEGVMACFEIVDSRIQGLENQIQDTVADNAPCGVFVLVIAWSIRVMSIWPPAAWCSKKNGEIVATGAGAARLGHPANAVAWLANTLGAHGIALEAGEVVLSGSLGIMVPVVVGDNLRDDWRHRRLLGALCLIFGKNCNGKKSNVP